VRSLRETSRFKDLTKLLSSVKAESMSAAAQTKHRSVKRVKPIPPSEHSLGNRFNTPNLKGEAQMAITPDFTRSI